MSSYVDVITERVNRRIPEISSPATMHTMRRRFSVADAAVAVCVTATDTWKVARGTIASVAIMERIQIGSFTLEFRSVGNEKRTFLELTRFNSTRAICGRNTWRRGPAVLKINVTIATEYISRDY